MDRERRCPILANRLRSPFGAHVAGYSCESTSIFLTTEKGADTPEGWSQKAVVSAPAKADSHTVSLGVDEDTYKILGGHFQSDSIHGKYHETLRVMAY